MLGNLPEDLLTQLSEVHRDRLAQQASTGRFVGVESRASRRCSVPTWSWPSREVSRRLCASTFVVFGVNGMSPSFSSTKPNKTCSVPTYSHWRVLAA